jgi:hypothetical protein
LCHATLVNEHQCDKHANKNLERDRTNSLRKETRHQPNNGLSINFIMIEINILSWSMVHTTRDFENDEEFKKKSKLRNMYKVND